jgi:hypothetical protein
MIDLRTKHQKSALRICLVNFHRRFRNIPVSRVAEIMTKLGHGREVIWWVSVTNSRKKFSWTARQFGNNQDTRDMLARNVKNVEFYGGPPGRYCNHAGTLLTFFLDRLLLTVSLDGFTGLDAVVPLGESYL